MRGHVIRLRLGDSFEILKQMPENSVIAVVCDPPYGLEFMGKDWDKLDMPQAWQYASGGFSKPGIGERATDWPSFSGGDPVHGAANPTCAECGGRLRGKKKCSCEQPHDHWKPLGKPRKAPANYAGITEGNDSPHARQYSVNFVGSPNPTCRKCGGLRSLQTEGSGGRKKCHCEQPDFPNHRSEVMPRMQAWHEGWLRECFRVLKPGGVIKAFAATRTMHRLAAAMEAAGFVLPPDGSLEAWSYGSGFPKSLNISKALDKMHGAQREKKRYTGSAARNPKSLSGGHGYEGEGYEGGDRPWLKQAREQGYYEADGDNPVTDDAKKFNGYGTALKPAWEPFVVGRKP